MSRFSSLLLKWYDDNKRSLPWRGKSDPYAVLVSEIMLQQTRVEAVIPYYLRWMERFPDIAALAAASERDVLLQWEGLGYYARARNLHRAAQILMLEHDGQLPRDLQKLRALPGVGRYTAGAIASIAFGLDEAALDGNIRRVLARVFDVSEPARSPAGEKILWQLAGKHLPSGRAGDYNQAIMDLGATICVPTRPRCSICPVRGLCAARKLGIQEQRPVLLAKRTSPHRVYAAAIIVRRGRVLLAQRPSKGLLGGMWEFPNGMVGGAPAKGLAKTIRKLYAIDVQPGGALGVLRHAYSHFTVEVHAFLCRAGDVPKRSNLRWASLGALDNFPMGRIDREVARKLRDG
jgi:A/G-specific adenine glycosylase